VRNLPLSYTEKVRVVCDVMRRHYCAVLCFLFKLYFTLSCLFDHPIGHISERLLFLSLRFLLSLSADASRFLLLSPISIHHHSLSHFLSLPLYSLSTTLPLSLPLFTLDNIVCYASVFQPLEWTLMERPAEVRPEPLMTYLISQSEYYIFV
jgi:hypothetical protein